jgi:hypothetical protein
VSHSELKEPKRKKVLNWELWFGIVGVRGLLENSFIKQTIRDKS